jgi:hypothetical protein
LNEANECGLDTARLKEELVEVITTNSDPNSCGCGAYAPVVSCQVAPSSLNLLETVEISRNQLLVVSNCLKTYRHWGSSSQVGWTFDIF